MSDDRPAPAPAARRRSRSIRAKLVSLTLLANLAGLVVAIFVARTLRGGLLGGSDTLWMASYYGAMVVVALFDAFLVDELVFGGNFRRAYLEGKDARQLERGGDDEAFAASMRPQGRTFPVVVVVCGLLTYFVFNLANDDFDSYYRTVGTHVAKLRSGTPEEQQAAVAQLSIRRGPHVMPALIQALHGEGPAAPWAAWALGRFHDLPTRHPVVTPLVGAMRSSNPAVRREALVALGRLQHRPAASAIHEEIRAQLAAGQTVDPRLMYALGSIQVLSSVPLLEELLHGADEETQRLAAWALAQHRDQRGGRAVVEVLEKRLPSASLPVRCAIVHGLGILADERSNFALMQAYDDATPDELGTLCDRITIHFRPDGGDDTALLLRPERKLGMKVVLAMGQMRATSADVRAAVEPWIIEVAANAPLPEIREGGQSLLAGIRGQRDDAKAKSVDQALGLEEGP
ncbi:HEAT repeat domain-containing protein [Paraliomyxa miuraensis]|uniref:HEAT repeat domain-containing protein n=1 Tax=Paraliomyxa miuraensis TaxID=376150 RepID=UPI00224CF93C|nr:HEAT repeat domain-containing protein [Paraliomyxa miuraensis]MCX4245654.1 HEAT repeat domain-containing protein [Paraliomyxa miuraensis]